MATAEVSYRNCIFRNATVAIALYSYNDLDQVQTDSNHVFVAAFRTGIL
jgi:hypothetical protein